MPLRDHFRPPLSRRRRPEEVLAMWPMMMALDVHPKLPDTVLPGPRRTPDDFGVTFRDDSDFGPTVAAVELVSLGHKVQASGRSAFLDKVVARLRQGAGVCVVDVVTDHQHNFYADLLATFEATDSARNNASSGVYAASFRIRDQHPVTRANGAT